MEIKQIQIIKPKWDSDIYTRIKRAIVKNKG